MSSAKIELLDIFSYSCMNCLRSLEHIKKFDKRYGKLGLIVKIIHVPEWEFEKDKSNIQNAIRRYKIKFSKIIDKDRKLLKNMKVDFWPAQILLKDARTEFGTNYIGGKEVYRHIGEGNYKSLEDKIRKELKINKKTSLLFKTEPKYSKHPAIYAGRSKNGKIAGLKDKGTINFGIIYTKGTFLRKKEYLESMGKGLIKIRTKGKKINIVARSLVKNPITVKIHYNKTKNNKKSNQKIIKIDGPRLYTLVQSKNNSPQILEIGTNKGLAIYSFSFQ